MSFVFFSGSSLYFPCKRGRAHFHLMFFFLWLWEKLHFTIICLFFWNDPGSLVHVTSALFQTSEPSTVQMSPLGSRRTRASRWFLENIWFDFSRGGCLRVTLPTCPVILWQFRKQKGEITFLKSTNGDGLSTVAFQLFLGLIVLFCSWDFFGPSSRLFLREESKCKRCFPADLNQSLFPPLNCAGLYVQAGANAVVHLSDASPPSAGEGTKNSPGWINGRTLIGQRFTLTFTHCRSPYGWHSATSWPADCLHLQLVADKIILKHPCCAKGVCIVLCTRKKKCFFLSNTLMHTRTRPGEKKLQLSATLSHKCCKCLLCNPCNYSHFFIFFLTQFQNPNWTLSYVMYSHKHPNGAIITAAKSLTEPSGCSASNQQPWSSCKTFSLKAAWKDLFLLFFFCFSFVF